MEEAQKYQVSSFPDIIEVPIKPDFDFIINACDGIWDCYTNEEAVNFCKKKRTKGPKQKKSSKSTAGSPTKTEKKVKEKGETSFIIEELMDQGIAKGDITMSDGTGTDNMTCIII